MLSQRKPECYDGSGELNARFCTADTYTTRSPVASGLGVGHIPSIDSDLGTPHRIIAMPFRRRDVLRGDALESLPGKQPLGSGLGGTSKHVRQTLPVRFL